MYIRKRWGQGFTYQTEDGKTLTDGRLRERLSSLPIPPAWTEVEIAEDPDADLLATGRDEAGRKQYLYSDSYRKRREREKFERIVGFGEKLETMRRSTGQHLIRERLDRKKVLACMVRLLDVAYFRPGNPYYTKENESYGLTTMRSRHLSIEGDELHFHYRGKSGVEQDRTVADRRLAQVVSELDEAPGYRIFKYFDEDGERHWVQSDDLNEYIREVMGGDYSAKDFRTWAGTLIAALCLDELGASTLEDIAQKRIRSAVEEVANRLGNTTAVARSSYIAPQVLESYQQGITTGYFTRQIKRELESPEELSVEELGLLQLLKHKL
ncbi:MAG TPA: DNA topoisomerase IB [Phycisphaerales bacterium]|nr:DNA topoisomerase IB [Phycisphaerales bacterium]